MIKVKKLLVSKAFALILSALLFYGPAAFAEPGNAEAVFNTALEAYVGGAYEQAAAKLEPVLNLPEAAEPRLKAKIYLLLGACYEKSGRINKAKSYYLLLKGMLEEGSIDRVPGLAGVDRENLTGYREVFSEDSLFKFNKPVTVADMMKKKVVHAPRKSIEQKEAERKKKKFPWLIAIGAVLIAGTAAVLLLAKSPERKIEIPVIDWVHIPAGEFMMGDNFNEGGADEQPVHEVYLDEYYISKHEITVGQYHAFCDDTGRERLGAYNPNDPAYFHETSPASAVSWDDAKAFCLWLSGKTGENIDLPTEAQWEKAARGTLQHRFPWGDSAPNCTLASYADCTNNYNNPLPPRPVGSFNESVSPYGVYEMAGNVAEWCRDWYSAAYYSISPKNNPAGPDGGYSRVIRGGGTRSAADDLRSAKRGHYAPGYRSSNNGFRVVKR